MDDLDQEIRFKSTLLKKVPADRRFNKMPSPLNVDTYDDVTDDADDAGDVIGNGVFVDKAADDTIDDGRLADVWRHDVAKSIKKVLKVDDFFDFDKIFNDKNDNNDDNIENDESIDNNENVSDKFLDLSEPLIEVLP